MPSRRLSSASLEAPVADLLQAVGVLVRRVRSESGPDARPWSQLAVVGRLQRGGAATTADLARAEQMKPQSMGALLAELEADGLVQRQAHPTDGRQVLFSLTPAGVEARRQRHAAKMAWLIDAIGEFDADEQRTLVAAIALLKRLGER